jgi:lysozyme family protein
MAKIQPLADFILSFEGGYVNHPNDKGGPTNMGVTLKTWQTQGYDKNGDGRIDAKDVKLITKADAISILRRCYWNRWKADAIKDQSIANILVDWVWLSGTPGITLVQAMLGVTADGIVGSKTLKALNAQPPKQFFERIKARRKQYIARVFAKRPSQKEFEAGWLRRLNAISYGSLITNGGMEISF